jgi:hypothetical protein
MQIKVKTKLILTEVLFACQCLEKIASYLYILGSKNLKANNLVLNVSKTKELVVDFRSKRTPIQPLVINDQEVEIVESFRFLGSIISCSLKWEDNVRAF